MKKNRLIIAISLIAILIIAAVTFYINLFYVGDARSDDVLYVDHIAVSTNQIQLDGGAASSGEAYRNYEYNISGEELYITIKYVLVSTAYQSGNFSIKIKDDFSQVKRIYLTGEEKNKLIWNDDPATAKTPITLPTDQIVSGVLQDGGVGGVLQYQLTNNELTTFIDYFNGREFTENDKEEGSTDRNSLSDSTDIVLHLDGEKNIYIMGYLDGETVITDQDGSRYSLYDPALTDYETMTMGGILMEKRLMELKIGLGSNTRGLFFLLLG